MRNARRSATDSRSAQVSQHQIHIAFNGERDKTGNYHSAARNSPIRGLIFANTQCKAPYRRIRRFSCSQASIRRIRSRWIKLPHLCLRARGRICRFEGPILRMRNVRRPTTASDATPVHKHQLDVHGHGGQRYLAHILGPGGVLAGLRAPFCEYAV